MQACRANVIIVEDDMGVSRAVARLLNIAGFRSSSFNSAEGLLQSDSAPAADCFVFDIHLPGLTGVELLDRLDRAGIHRPVIFITAHDDAYTRHAARGGTSYLTKPFTGQALIQAIDAALARAH